MSDITITGPNNCQFIHNFLKVFKSNTLFENHDGDIYWRQAVARVCRRGNTTIIHVFIPTDTPNHGPRIYISITGPNSCKLISFLKVITLALYLKITVISYILETGGCKGLQAW